MILHDPFGRIDPGCLDRPGRIACLRRLAGTLQAGDTAEQRWLGRSLARWLDGAGHPLEQVLGIAGRRGSRSAAGLALAERRAEALIRLAAAIGSDAAAVRVLRGQAACPESCAELLAECTRLRCPTSRAAVSRARELVSTF